MDNITFHNKIEDFLSQSGMAATTFGRESLRDPGFVARLRKGARSWPETQDRCFEFIASHQMKEAS
jgi:2,4-dienoyl-CoA reductase-like NADH-dependent reductase (Old Yellow Enzyme family)